MRDQPLVSPHHGGEEDLAWGTEEPAVGSHNEVARLFYQLRARELGLSMVLCDPYPPFVPQPPLARPPLSPDHPFASWDPSDESSDEMDWQWSHMDEDPILTDHHPDPDHDDEDDDEDEEREGDWEGMNPHPPLPSGGNHPEQEEEEEEDDDEDSPMVLASTNSSFVYVPRTQTPSSPGTREDDDPDPPRSVSFESMGDEDEEEEEEEDEEEEGKDHEGEEEGANSPPSPTPPIPPHAYDRWRRFQWNPRPYPPAGFRAHVSSHATFVRRMKRVKRLEGHGGCVNTIHWSQDGRYLISGGDDLTLALWDQWHDHACTFQLQTAHRSNIFSAYFLPRGDNEQVVSCARDGRVLAYQLDGSCHHVPGRGEASGLPSGAPLLLQCHCHEGPAKRLTVDVHQPSVFQSCGEDGRVLLFDLRERHVCGPEAPGLLDLEVPLMCLDTHPIHSETLLICGENEILWEMDKRMPGQVSGMYGVNPYRGHHHHVTGVRYSDDGQRIVASYSQNPIYCFDTFEDHYPDSTALREALARGSTYRQEYRGHANIQTVKSVNFFGPHSEYVISGSDCGSIFIWDTFSGDLVNYWHADRDIVNCIEGHPQQHTLLASSGIEDHVYLWAPTDRKENPMPDKDTVVSRNSNRDVRMPGPTLRMFINQMLMERQRLGLDEDDMAPTQCPLQ